MEIRWWVSANPKIWRWETLFETGRVAFRYGRIKRNYPQLAVGDLVVGYASAPVGKLVALAVVAAVNSADDASRFELKPWHQLAIPLKYDDLLADPVLMQSEPIRCRNQGILFAVSPKESDRLLGLMATERLP